MSGEEDKDFGVTGNTSVDREMQKSFLEYAMSVITSRALPDVRDGMKPVHRRIIYAMAESHFTSDRPYRKSARVVGDVMGKYHPHGDSSIYEALVRMAQKWSQSAPMIDGQGNFGSIDGDSPAAMRYTESRTTKFSEASFMRDIDEDTVDFRPNYDSSEQEPCVLPARIPNILVNGGSGIAVGMANNIPPHNLGEVVDATLMLMDKPNVTLEELMQVLPGPDFPTGGVILGRGSIRNAYETGNGSIPYQGVFSIETDKKGRESIIITEIAYALNKTNLIMSMAQKIKDKVLDGIADIRDESNRDGIRIVIEVKRDSSASLVINHLLKKTQLRTSYGANMTVLDIKGVPQVLPLMDILRQFITFRRDCVFRRTMFRLKKARKELERQIGFVAATTMIDHIISLIRASSDRKDALNSLLNLDFPVDTVLHGLLTQINPDEEPPKIFKLSEDQAKDIVSMRLGQLTGLEQDELLCKARDLDVLVSELIGIIEDSTKIDEIIRNEMIEIRDAYSVPRRTRIEASGPSDIDDDDLIEDKQVILTMTRQGYVKITPVEDYREQRRGGKGKSGMDPKDGDYVTTTLMCNARDKLMIFTSRGIAHTLKAYKIPEANANARGRPIVNYGINLRPGESIATIMVMPTSDEEIRDRYMMFVTDHGTIRRNSVEDFARVNSNGKIAMKLEDEHGVQTASLITVLPCTEKEDLLLFTGQGKAIRFHVKDIRVSKGRNSQGVRGITLPGDYKVIGATVIDEFEATSHERDAYLNGGETSWIDDEGEHELVLSDARKKEMNDGEQTLLTVSSNGYGKRFSSYSLRASGRGGQGVWIGNFGETSGNLVACFPVDDSDGIFIATDGGQVIRTGCQSIRIMGRVTRGVTLINLSDNAKVVDVARLVDDNENDE